MAIYESGTENEIFVAFFPHIIQVVEKSKLNFIQRWLFNSVMSFVLILINFQPVHGEKKNFVSFSFMFP